MKYLVLSLVALLALAAGGVAVYGRVHWGDAGWYYHTDPDYRLRAGQDALRHDRLDRADEVAQAMEADGYKDHAALLRGQSLYAQGKALYELRAFDRAEPLFMKAVVELNKIKDQDAIRRQAALTLGQACVFLGRPVDAEVSLRFVLQEDPDNVEAHRGLAAVYFDLGAMQPALAHFERVADLDPQDGRPFRTMALICKDLDQNEQAVKYYEQALGRNLYNQSLRKIRLEWAECLLKLKRSDEALRVLEPVEADPDDTQLAALKGEALWGLGRPADARAQVDRALAAHGHDVALLVLRAKLHLEAKETDRAVELLERATALDAHDFAARYQLVLAYRAQGQKARADEQQRLLDQTQKDLQEMTRLFKEATDNPWDPKPRLRLAELSERLGKPREAAQWRQAAALCPPAPRS